MITPEHHERLMDAFDTALELEGAARDEYVAQVTAGDPEFRRELETLLASHASSGPLDTPALGPEFHLDEVAAESLAAPLPDRVGEFEILGLLGEGGMGIVYHARQRSPAREVALKLIRPGRASAEARRRFRTEVETLARLRHPGIAAIYGTGTVLTDDGTQPYIVMEYVRGEPLSRFAKPGGLSRVQQVLLLARICEAIAHAHQRGVIHRDLKPANVIVELVDGVPQPRIVDFGVARLSDGDSGAATLATRPGQLLGTLAYMSPEQLEGDPHVVDTRTDVYAIGAIGYELLAGCLPIDVGSGSAFAAIKAVLERTPAPMRTTDRTIDPDLDTIILTALAKERDARYASATGLAADLRRYLAQRPIAARPPSTWYTLRKYAQRNRLLTAALAVGCLGLLWGIAGTVHGWVQARRAAAELQAQLDQSSAAAKFLTRDVVAHLDTIAGTFPVRRLLLNRLKLEVTELLRRTPEDPGLRGTWADLLTHESDLELNEGNYGRALELRETALELRRTLAAESPGDLDLQAELSIALVKVGDVYKDRGELDLARPWYEQAYVIDARLAAAAPASEHYLDNLAWSHDRLGFMAFNGDDRTAAEQHYRVARDILLGLRERDPSNEGTLRGLQSTESALAGLASLRGDPALAVERRRAALGIARQLVARHPYQRLYLHNEAACLVELAWTLPAEAAEEAAGYYEQAEQRTRQVLALDPSDVVMQKMLVNCLAGRGQIEAQLGHADRGAQLIAEANARRAAIAEQTQAPASDN